MKVGSHQISVLVLLNVILGVFVTGGAGITALTDAFGNQRWISVVGLSAGLIQLVAITYVHETTSSSGPAKPA